MIETHASLGWVYFSRIPFYNSVIDIGSIAIMISPPNGMEHVYKSTKRNDLVVRTGMAYVVPFCSNTHTQTYI